MYKKLIVLLFVVSSCDVVETVDNDYGTFKLQYLYQPNLNYIVKTVTNEGSIEPYGCTPGPVAGIEFNPTSPNIDTLYIDFQYNIGRISFKGAQQHQEDRKRPMYINHMEIMNVDNVDFSAIGQLKHKIVLRNDIPEFKIIYKTSNSANLFTHFFDNCEDVSLSNFNSYFTKGEPVVEIEHSVSQNDYEFYDIGYTYEAYGEKYRVIDKWIK